MLDLYISHGRTSPDQQLDDWGPQGPRLRECIGVHQTYGMAAKVYFANAAAMVAAQALTGWETWDDNALTMRWHEDMLVCEREGVKMFYGDWGLIKSTAEVLTHVHHPVT